MHSDLADQSLVMAVEAVYEGVTRFMPAGPYRDFYQWALSEENPERATWLRMLGIPQMTKMTLRLLDGLVDQDTIEQIIFHSLPMNVYLTFEIASDDLAIGLDGVQNDTIPRRQALVSMFNEVMLATLGGTQYSTPALMARFAHFTQNISSFEQSIVPSKYYAMAQAYLRADEGALLEDLEYSLPYRLIANIEAAAAVAALIQPYQVGNLVQSGLMNRYRGVTALIEDPQMSLLRRVFIGADTILVSPTLAYYIGIYAEAIRPVENFSTVIENGSLAEALYAASLLVRLFNDVGTGLLTNAQEQSQFLQRMKILTSSLNGDDVTVSDMLLQFQHLLEPHAARLYKDLVLGEFNVCLSGVTALPVSQGVPILEERLNFLSSLYSQFSQRFEVSLKGITTTLEDPVVSELIRRFVVFHHSLYANDYQDSAGEYAG